MSEQATNESVWSLLGFRKRKKASAYDVIKAIRTGLPAQSVKVFSDAVDLSLKELSAYIHVSSKTLERRLKDNVALNVDASDRLVEMAWDRSSFKVDVRTRTDQYRVATLCRHARKQDFCVHLANLVFNRHDYC